MVDKKKLRNDIILITSLFLVALICLIVVFVTQKKDNLVAKIMVQDNVVEVVDLNNKEERNYLIEGLNGQVEVRTKDGAIAIVKSNCPHQDCVRTGYVKTSNKPIICAYNAVCISISGGQNEYDTEIGS